MSERAPSFAEFVLRLGVSLVAWLVIYTHLTMLLGVGVARCPDEDPVLWRASLMTAVLAMLAAGFVGQARSLPGTIGIGRVLVLPLALLLPWAIWVTLPFLTGTTLGTLDLCAVALGLPMGETPSGWQRAWAPSQLAVLAVITIAALRSLRIAHLLSRRAD